MRGSADTVVEVEFAIDGTLVTLTHSGFDGDEIAALHEHGWNGTLAQPAAHLGA